MSTNLTATVTEYNHPGVPRFEAAATEPPTGALILANGPTKEEAQNLLRGAEEARKTTVAVEEVEL